MAIGVDVISQLENYVITKEALEVILLDAYFITGQIKSVDDESYISVLRKSHKLTCACVSY